MHYPIIICVAINIHLTHPFIRELHFNRVRYQLVEIQLLPSRFSSNNYFNIPA